MQWTLLDTFRWYFCFCCYSEVSFSQDNKDLYFAHENKLDRLPMLVGAQLPSCCSKVCLSVNSSLWKVLHLAPLCEFLRLLRNHLRAIIMKLFMRQLDTSGVNNLWSLTCDTTFLMGEWWLDIQDSAEFKFTLRWEGFPGSWFVIIISMSFYFLLSVGSKPGSVPGLYL